MNPADPSAQSDLAQGFAAHAAAWAAECGAPADSVALLRSAAARLALAIGEGHVCVRLDALGADPVRLRERLLASGVVGTPAQTPARPVVLDDQGRLYLHRHFDYERRLAAALMRRAAPLAEVDARAARARLDALFAANAARLVGRPDWQKLAVALALERRLTVISGGPGTGKTTTVAALLACLLELQPALRVALAAPTGKAAARMLAALRARAAGLPPGLRALLPAESHTIHRLLGVTPAPGRFRHDAANPLALDVLVVDEASMLDLALATRLVEALPPTARLILLGDKDQLAAVEAGAVFAELSADPDLGPACRARLAALTGTPAERIVPPAARSATPLADCVVWFADSHRFAPDSGIGRLAADINAGEGARALGWLVRGEDAAATWIEDEGGALATATVARIEQGYAAYVDALRGAPRDAAAAFAAFDRFRVLCAVHDGPRGARAINEQLGRFLRRRLALPAGAGSPWYPGRPVIVLRNDPVLRLYNGDVGLCLPGEDGEPAVHFPLADGGWRRLAPLRLPEHDTAFAMTVHKSQGSEFGEVLLVLPAMPAKVMSRELLYTGVTRAAGRVAVAGSRAAFLAACDAPTVRHSGLLERLRESAAADGTHG